MVDRRYKISENGNALHIIRKYLVVKGKATVSEIAQELKDKKINYKSKRAVIARLNRLVDQKFLDKITTTGHPRYYLPNSGRLTPSNIGIMIKYETMDFLEQIRLKLDFTDFLLFFTGFVGVYTMYVELLSWKLFKDEKNFKKRARNRQEFLDDALPLRVPVASDIEHLYQLYDIKKIEDIYENVEKNIINFELELEKTYPKYLKFCKLIFKEVRGTITKIGEQKEPL